MAKSKAIMCVCPGVVNEGTGGHSMRDACWSCAPFWEQYPTCPTCKDKLTKNLYCKACRKHYAEADRLDMAQYRGFAA